MNCPQCQQPMIRAGGHWVCGHHNPPVFVPVEEASGPQPETVPAPVRELPSLLAIPFHEYFGESHPVMRVHRLCDAVEILTRFCTIAALGELRQQLGDEPLPAGLLAMLQPNIERPTFGVWRPD